MIDEMVDTDQNLDYDSMIDHIASLQQFALEWQAVPVSMAHHHADDGHADAKRQDYRTADYGQRTESD